VKPESPVRVFIVDDSAVSRTALQRAVESDGDGEVVGQAVNGLQALEEIPEVRPDVVLMDIVMGGMDGLETTQALMSRFPLPVLIVSDLVGRAADLNFKALQAGALDVLRKPTSDDLADRGFVRRLQRKVRMLAGVPVITRHSRRARRPARPEEPTAPDRAARPTLVCIGASTGGPPAILRILKDIGPSLPWPVVVVQHMSRGFTAGMVKWLADTTALDVVFPGDRTVPEPGVVYVAGEDRHLVLRDSRLWLDDAPPLAGHRPSVDELFFSVAASEVARTTIAVLLSGMGSDGARGLRQIHRAGGWTVAQDEASSVVFGMPKAAIDLGGVSEIVPASAIGPRLADLSRG